MAVVNSGGKKRNVFHGTHPSVTELIFSNLLFFALFVHKLILVKESAPCFITWICFELECITKRKQSIVGVES